LQRSLRAALDTQRVQSQHVAGRAGFDLLIVPVDRPLWADRDDTRLLVYISGRERDFRDRSSHIAAAFDLSPTQARLATLLVEGRSLTAAAKEIGITEQTARTYSKEIYSRTGTSRQGDLIQRLLKSVITLA
jgi:DNA-binding CsgD family transcriptional regulator